MAYVAYPSAFLYPEPKEMPTRMAVEHYPWGFWVTLLGEKKNGFVKVRETWRDESGQLHRHAWMREEDIQPNRLLEVNFVDIGQGDGCFIVTPNDDRLLIDAGESDNMYRFLRWRFNRKPVHIHDVIISHPDKDHYLGFDAMARDDTFSFGNVYHNGIVEREGADPLGPRTKSPGSVLTDVIETPEQLDSILDKPAKVGRKLYPNLLKRIRDSGRADVIWMLHVEDQFLPGYEADQDVAIQVLAPIPERKGDRLRLPWFGSAGMTKNGHSIVLRLRYGGIAMLLGGDLNIESENYLLRRYTGLDPETENLYELQEMLGLARRYFGCDLMKACHHGSSDFTELFLQAVHPLATVISSGDQESHAHPRPDALGAFGKYARGPRPLIFSTELARSTKEKVETPANLQREIKTLIEFIGSEGVTASQSTAAGKRIEYLTGREDRAVAVYGMITARTDGEKLMLTQKLEEKRSSTGEKWDIHLLEPDADGHLQYVSKH